MKAISFFDGRAGTIGLALSCVWLAGCGLVLRDAQRAPLLRATGGLPPMLEVQPRGMVSVPMVRDSQHTVPIVRARLNGGELFPLVLDSGGNHTMIGRQRANQSRLAPLGGSGQITTAFGNQEPTQLAVAGELALGSLSIRGMPVLVHGFGTSTLSKSLGGELNVMGTPAMAACSYITFDYRRHQVIFSYHDAFPAPTRDRALRLPLDVTSEGHLSAPVTFPGRGTKRAIIDTGYDGVLLMSRPTVDALGLGALTEKGRTVKAVGPGAELQGRVFVLPEIEIDGRPIANVEAWTGRIDEPLLLGSGLLRYFRTTFDFRRMILWLEVE